MVITARRVDLVDEDDGAPHFRARVEDVGQLVLALTEPLFAITESPLQNHHYGFFILNVRF